MSPSDGVALDTNVLSELRKPKAEQKVLDFVASTPLEELFVSVVTLTEIRYGIDLNVDAQSAPVYKSGSPSRCARCSTRSAGDRRHRTQLADDAGRRAQDRPHLFPAGPVHRGDRSSARLNGCHPRPQPVRQGAYSRHQSLGILVSVISAVRLCNQTFRIDAVSVARPALRLSLFQEGSPGTAYTGASMVGSPDSSPSPPKPC